MNLKDQLQTMAKGKNASYSAIADYLLARKSYAGLKLKEVAHACHVSDATVVRFCPEPWFRWFFRSEVQSDQCLAAEMASV